MGYIYLQTSEILRGLVMPLSTLCHMKMQRRPRVASKDLLAGEFRAGKHVMLCGVALCKVCKRTQRDTGTVLLCTTVSLTSTSQLSSWMAYGSLFRLQLSEFDHRVFAEILLVMVLALLHQYQMLSHRQNDQVVAKIYEF